MWQYTGDQLLVQIMATIHLPMNEPDFTIGMRVDAFACRDEVHFRRKAI